MSRVVVPVRPVAVLDDDYELLDPTRVDPDYVTWGLNEDDDAALDATLAVDAAEVVCVTVGPQECDWMVFDCLARGAGRGIRVWDDALAHGDELVAAQLLAGDAVRPGASLLRLVPPPRRHTEMVRGGAAEVAARIAAAVRAPVGDEAAGLRAQLGTMELELVPDSPEERERAEAAALAGGRNYASGVTALRWDGGLVAQRPVYDGKLIAELGFPAERGTILALRRRALAQAVGDIGAPEIMLSIGRGALEAADGLVRFQRLADVMGATLTCSRPPVEIGGLGAEHLVGQSGMTAEPDVYLAMGISGASHHLAGIRDAGTVVAVNTDPGARIFDVADVGAVADMFEVADALEEIFKTHRRDA